MLVSENSDKVITIREDPQRGVFVNSNENIVTDFESLLGNIFAGEKKRSIASTAMNKRLLDLIQYFELPLKARKGLRNQRITGLKVTVIMRMIYLKKSLTRKMMEQYVYQH